MDFDPPADLIPRLAAARRFLDHEVVPHEREVLERGFVASAALLDGLRARVRAAGLWGPATPRGLGGLGLGLVEHGLMSEVLGRSPLGHYVFGSPAPDAGNIELLERLATPAQRTRWLEPLAAGAIRSCFSMTEPDRAGSNPTQLDCRAVLDGEHWVLDGHKWFTSSADGAAVAIVMAVTDPEAAPHARASMILVPTDTPGFERVRNIPVMGHAGDGWGSHSEIRYVGCRVPRDHLLGERGKGFAAAQERLGPGRIHHAMRWIGISERAFDEMCARARARELAPGEPLASKQLIQAWVAERRAAIDAARLLVLRAAWTIERHGFAAARDQVSLVKFFVADVMLTTVDVAIQVHGALGISGDSVLSWFYAHERGARIYDGPDEVHKLVVARRLLASPRAAGG